MDLAGSPSARAVKRIEDVRVLRTAQFPEDAGPMAHPVRPDSYVEINNFYTVTIYEKGAEVVRMMQTLVGRSAEGLCQGHEAVLRAPRRPGRDLRRFRPGHCRRQPGSANWPTGCRSSSAGTARPARPVCKPRGQYDAAERALHAHAHAKLRPTPGQPSKSPSSSRWSWACSCADGRELPLQLDGRSRPGRPPRAPGAGRACLQLTFVNVDSAPVPSLLRGFQRPGGAGLRLQRRRSC
jgi:aminopeptidase N